MWPGFLESFFFEERFAGLNTSALWRGEMGLQMEGRGDEGDDYRFAWIPVEGMEGARPSEKSWRHELGTASQLTLGFNLGGLSAYPFRLSISDIADDEPVDLQIGLSSDDRSVYHRLLVYGVPGGGGSPQKLACAGEYVDAYVDLEISGAGAWDELLFIVCNTDCFRHTTLEEAYIRVEITVSPVVVVEEEEEEEDPLLGKWEGVYTADSYSPNTDCIMEEFECVYGYTPGRGNGDPDWWRGEKRLSFIIERGHDGNYEVAYYGGSGLTTGQGSHDIYWSSVTDSNIEFRSIHMHYEGVIDPEDQSIQGTFNLYHGTACPQDQECGDCGVIGEGTWHVERVE